MRKIREKTRREKRRVRNNNNNTTHVHPPPPHSTNGPTRRPVPSRLRRTLAQQVDARGIPLSRRRPPPPPFTTTTMIAIITCAIAVEYARVRYPILLLSSSLLLTATSRIVRVLLSCDGRVENRDKSNQTGRQCRGVTRRLDGPVLCARE